MNQDLQIQSLIKQIVQAFIDAGISKEQAGNIMLELDKTIYQAIATDVVDALDEEELEDMEDDTGEISDFKQISELLGIREEDIKTYYIHSLEEYLAKLPEKIPSIKAKLSVSSS